MATNQISLDISRFHHDLDLAIEKIEAPLREQLSCKAGCHDCCVDDISVFEVEAVHIRKEAAKVLEEKPHPTGKCAFLNEKGNCRIYHVRPYVCRTQGLPLSWVDEDEVGGWVNYRDICPLNEAVPIEDLPDESCWEIGPYEGRLARLQKSQGDMKRVALRDLFKPWLV